MRSSDHDPRRTSYLVAYDVSSPRRLARVHRFLRTQGTALQYSIFVCDLTRWERGRLRLRLAALIDARRDRIAIVPVVPVQMELLGRIARQRDADGISVA